MSELLQSLQRIDQLLQTYCVSSPCHGVLRSHQTGQPRQDVAVPHEVEKTDFQRLSREKQEAIVSVLDAVRSMTDPPTITVAIDRLCVYATFTNSAQLIVLVFVDANRPTSYICYLRPTITHRVYTAHARTFGDMNQIGQSIAQFSKFKWFRGLNENVRMDAAIPFTNDINITDAILKDSVAFLASITPDPAKNIRVDESCGVAHASFTENVELFVSHKSGRNLKCYIRLDKSDAVYVVPGLDLGAMKEIGQIVKDISNFAWVKGSVRDTRMSRILDGNKFADEIANDP
jgi:hypothetical protein